VSNFTSTVVHGAVGTLQPLWAYTDGVGAMMLVKEGV